MPNSLWVILWKAVSWSSLTTNRKWVTWHCTFCETQFYPIVSFDQQLVSDISHFVKGHRMTCFLVINSKWVTLDICERQSRHIFSYDQQSVSDIALLWKAVSPHLSLWPTACEWHCTFCERQSHHIFSYDQQHVSNIMQDVSLYLISSLNFVLCLEDTRTASLQSRYLCSSFISVTHNFLCCFKKHTDCQIFVCKLFPFIYHLSTYIVKQLLSLPSYPFGSINHLQHQLQKPWINTSKKAMFRTSRLALHLALWTVIIKI